jgi:hypothetical protein
MLLVVSHPLLATTTSHGHLVAKNLEKKITEFPKGTRKKGIQEKIVDRHTSLETG